MTYVIATHRPGKFYSKRYCYEDGHVQDIECAKRWKTRKAAERTCEFLRTLGKITPSYFKWHVVEID